MEWQAIFLIAGMYPISLAMVNTGLATRMGEVVVQVVAPFGPLGLAAGAYIFHCAADTSHRRASYDSYRRTHFD